MTTVEVVFVDDRARTEAATVEISPQSGYCYDVYVNSVVVNANKQAVEIAIPNKYGDESVKHYVGFLTGQQTFETRLGIDDVNLALMLCDDRYLQYIFGCVYSRLQNRISAGLQQQQSPRRSKRLKRQTVNRLKEDECCSISTQIQSLVPTPQSDKLRLISKINRTWSPAALEMLWLDCPYQLLPDEHVSNPEFMVNWLKCKSNRKVETANYIYYCKESVINTLQDKQLSVYTRRKPNLDIVGATMTVKISKSGFISEIIFCLDTHRTTSVGWSQDDDSLSSCNVWTQWQSKLDSARSPIKMNNSGFVFSRRYSEIGTPYVLSTS